MISGAQIRAARGLLDWTRDDLAKRCGVTGPAIKNIESNPDVKPHQKTLEAIADVFRSHGVEFTERGVCWADKSVRILEGEDAYMRMLDDVFYVTSKRAGEVLWAYGDDRSVRPGELEAEERIRSNGARFRSLIQEGSDYVRWDRKEYRQVPKAYFNHDLQVIYGDKVAQVVDGGRQILIIDNASLAKTERGKFDLLWQFLQPLSKKGKKL